MSYIAEKTPLNKKQALPSTDILTVCASLLAAEPTLDPWLSQLQSLQVIPSFKAQETRLNDATLFPACQARKGGPQVMRARREA